MRRFLVSAMALLGIHSIQAEVVVHGVRHDLSLSSRALARTLRPPASVKPEIAMLSPEGVHGLSATATHPCG